jgi:hypothetical protein
LHIIYYRGNRQSFSEIQRIDLEYSSSSAGSSNYKYPRRKIHPVVYVLITNNYATLDELKHKYTINEVIDLYEMCMCNISNKAFAIQERS